MPASVTWTPTISLNASAAVNLAILDTAKQ